MTQKEMVAYNERFAIEKIRTAYSAGDMAEAMQLVHITMGIDDMKAAYSKVLEICKGDKL